MFVFRDKGLKENCEIRNSLKIIPGVGYLKSEKTCNKIGISYPFFIDDLNIYNFKLIFFLLKNYIVTDVKLIRFHSANILKLVNFKHYRGFRHSLRLPVRGQRTRTNARNQKK